MTDAPERIKAWCWNGRIDSGQWHVNGQGETIEYVRADVAAAALRAAEARADAALLDASRANVAEAKAEARADKALAEVARLRGALDGSVVAMRSARGVVVSKMEHALLTGALVNAAEALAGVKMPATLATGAVPMTDPKPFDIYNPIPRGADLTEDDLRLMVDDFYCTRNWASLKMRMRTPEAIKEQCYRTLRARLGRQPLVIGDGNG